MRASSFKAVKPAIALSIAVSSITGCAASNPSSTDSTAASPTAARVVATTTILCDLVEQIAATTIDLTCLIQPGVDSHVYQTTPTDRKAIEDAQLILYSGYNLEPNLIKLIQSTSNPAPKVAVAEMAVPSPIVGEAHEHEHAADPATEIESDSGEVADPHVWQNAENGKRMAEVIAENLIRIAPQNEALYTKNAAALFAQLNQIHTWIKAEIATIPAPTRKLVTTHDAMGYYAAAYGIPVEGALQGISTEEAPTAAQIKELVNEVKTAQVPTIFAEAAVNPKLIQTVAKEANVKVSSRELFSDSLGESGSGAETYTEMLVFNTQTIVEGLGGQYKPFKATQP